MTRRLECPTPRRWAPVKDWREDFDDAWFAGFTAGEACFFIHKQRGRLAPCFRILLRDDDAAILRELRDSFGGALHERRPNGEGGRFAAVEWVVAHRDDMARLLDYFDTYALRAKKARDYIVWREAVAAYTRAGGRAAELPGLHVALRAARVYSAH